MYGGYRGLRKSEDNSNSSAPGSGSTNPNGFRGLLGHSGITQPVRTKHLLEELREVYDDIDNSASKRSPHPPEDDPLISWDKHSLPKGLEWMKPTPSKNKTAVANTIPETVNNVHNRNVSYSKAGLLATGDAQNSSVSSSDKPKSTSDLKKLNEKNVEPSPPVLNEFDKENVFMPLRSQSESALPKYHEVLSSTKKCPSMLKLDKESGGLDTDLLCRTVKKEDFFTPLKRSRTDSTPVTVKVVSSQPSAKITTILENDSVEQKVSPPLNHGHHLQSGRKSPQLLSMQPHLSLLTPVAHMKSSGSAFSSRKATFPSLNSVSNSVPLENQQSCKADNLDPWMTPAKGYSLVNSKPGKSFGQLTYGMTIKDTSKVEENCSKVADCNPMDVMQSALKGPDQAPPIEEKNQPSVMSSEPRNVQAMSSCLSTPKIPYNPLPGSTIKSVSKTSTEMPPPEIRKQPVKPSPESVQHGLNHPASSNVSGKSRTSDHICVNGKQYTILSLLGRGGSSVVYQVIDPVTSSLMAVKCVNLSELDQSTYEGYLNEISLLAQLQDSDCVIRMFDHQHCKEEKLLYVVMEKGETDLSKLIREVTRTKKISPAMIVYYWTEMLNAVSFIHKKGTIHSDLKPANFLLVAGRLKLIDFGIASAIQADMTSVVKDSMTGTYNYISPEALCSTGSGPDGRSMRFKISYKSDVWSLGCILYNLVYGHTPFQTITHQFTKMKAIADPKHRIPFPPAPGCPRVLLQAMQACLVRDPKQRPSVDELLQYPYLGSVEQVVDKKMPVLLEQISSVIRSTQSPSEKLSCIQTLLSTSK